MEVSSKDSEKRGLKRSLVEDYSDDEEEEEKKRVIGKIQYL
jgi:hypothetical protein